MRFQKSHMQIHEAYQFLHKKRSAQVTESLTDCMPPATQRNSPCRFLRNPCFTTPPPFHLQLWAEQQQKEEAKERKQQVEEAEEEEAARRRSRTMPHGEAESEDEGVRGKEKEGEERRPAAQRRKTVAAAADATISNTPSSSIISNDHEGSKSSPNAKLKRHTSTRNSFRSSSHRRGR